MPTLIDKRVLLVYWRYWIRSRCTDKDGYQEPARQYVNAKCSALTASIGIDVWVRARVDNLKQQLSQMSVVETV